MNALEKEKKANNQEVQGAWANNATLKQKDIENAGLKESLNQVGKINPGMVQEPEIKASECFNRPCSS
ncbi:hypothetical protein [Helicobacter bizzozeronii]|uniref:hypothetical protein n=1 Tax=Helicobacter bizzozeronii TaxID=56877 RepID=UPI0013158193|nr:hypothetical protein [Helicobacter bizzozeronii]